MPRPNAFPSSNLGRRAAIALIAATGAAHVLPIAHAAENIVWLVGFPPGGTADVLTRTSPSN